MTVMLLTLIFFKKKEHYASWNICQHSLKKYINVYIERLRYTLRSSHQNIKHKLRVSCIKYWFTCKTRIITCTYKAESFVKVEWPSDRNNNFGNKSFKISRFQFWDHFLYLVNKGI